VLENVNNWDKLRTRKMPQTTCDKLIKFLMQLKRKNNAFLKRKLSNLYSICEGCRFPALKMIFISLLTHNPSEIRITKAQLEH
jgi:hypothetical protein